MPPYPTGSWMPIALSADLPAGTVMPAQSPAGPVALWRSRSGRTSASADRCPHRGMRLSHGFVRGEALNCIYHGWSYGQTGSCVRIPAHPGLTPPESIRVATYAVEEADGVIWVAVGQPSAETPRFEGLMNLQKLRLLLAPQDDDQTLVHVLLQESSDPSDRISASRAADALRRLAEDLQRKGIA